MRKEREGVLGQNKKKPWMSRSKIGKSEDTRGLGKSWAGPESKRRHPIGEGRGFSKEGGKSGAIDFCSPRYQHS